MEDAGKRHRCFIAIQIPEELKAALADFLSTLAKTGADVRWVRPEAMHLTLHFLGSISPGQVEEASEIVRESAAAHAPFALDIEGAGGFPRLESPRVVWVGITAPPDLFSLHDELRRRLAGKKFEVETRGFTPHLTLGRVRSTKGIKPVVEICREAGVRRFGRVEVGRIFLMESFLSPAGSRYRELVSAGLAGRRSEN